jgi:hypothetical protein
LLRGVDGVGLGMVDRKGGIAGRQCRHCIIESEIFLGPLQQMRCRDWSFPKEHRLMCRYCGEKGSVSPSRGDDSGVGVVGTTHGGRTFDVWPENGLPQQGGKRWRASLRGCDVAAGIARVIQPCCRTARR